MFPVFPVVIYSNERGAKIKKKLDKRNGVFQERKMGITGVPFGRTELSLMLS